MAEVPSKRVQAALDALHPGLRVVTFDALTDTAAAAAAAAGCELGQIVKSLLFVVDRRRVMLLVAGDRKADTARLAPLLGVPRKRIRMASSDEVRELTGFEVGGVPPLGHPRPIETLLDDSLERFDDVWSAAGTPHAIFRVDLDLLKQLSGARTAAIAGPVS
jgi:prolyl-tRNA editing enzyme YbaK/EbsC (Cys-tRNA(Pro) deacylase)